MDTTDKEPCTLEQSLKRRSLQGPWPNAEQESLYVAVERLNSLVDGVK